jgi:hypothetical protein
MRGLEKTYLIFSPLQLPDLGDLEFCPMPAACQTPLFLARKDAQISGLFYYNHGPLRCTHARERRLRQRISPTGRIDAFPMIVPYYQLTPPDRGTFP